MGQVPHGCGGLQNATVHQEQVSLRVCLCRLLGAMVVLLVDGVEALEAATGAQQELRAGLDLQGVNEEWD